MRLKTLRAKRGWTQKQLATRAGISHGYLARLELGMQDPTLTILEKLARALRLTVGKLVDASPAVTARAASPTRAKKGAPDGTTR